jgi:hypothetical protein
MARKTTIATDLLGREVWLSATTDKVARDLRAGGVTGTRYAAMIDHTAIIRAVRVEDGKVLLTLEVVQTGALLDYFSTDEVATVPPPDFPK